MCRKAHKLRNRGASMLQMTHSYTARAIGSESNFVRLGDAHSHVSSGCFFIARYNNSMNYWLIKTEADCYSIDDFKKDKKIPWTGIRNYQARNYMRDLMKVGDMALFYHSSSDPTGVFGVAKVVSEPHPDSTALDSKDEHFDPKSTKEKPIWFCVDVAFVEKFKSPVTLAQIKFDPKLEGIIVAKQGSRLSVQPVSEKHFKRIVELGRK